VTVLDQLLGRRFGVYDLVEVLGRGGMGMVFRAVHSRLNEPRAVKVLSPQLAQDETFRRRFRREAFIPSELGHPNIIVVYDAAEHEGFPYLAMELVVGVSLRQLIEAEGPLAPERAVGLLGQLADALDFAHGHGIVHRDLKPSNVMVGPDDHATLLDFGSAKGLTGVSLTPAGLIVGTPDYMAPEVLTGATTSSPSVDQYGLGLLAYEMLTGALPFVEPPSIIESLSVKLTPPLRARSFRPELPRMADVVLLRQLDQDPEQRYPTCRAFVEALIEVLH
jgi:serine/threonine-protein kinase